MELHASYAMDIHHSDHSYGCLVVMHAIVKLEAAPTVNNLKHIRRTSQINSLISIPPSDASFSATSSFFASFNCAFALCLGTRADTLA